MLLEHFPTTPGEVFSVDLDEDGLHRVVCNVRITFRNNHKLSDFISY